MFVLGVTVSHMDIKQNTKEILKRVWAAMKPIHKKIVQHMSR